MRVTAQKGGAAPREATPSDNSDCKDILETNQEYVNGISAEELENNSITNLTLRFMPKSPAYPQLNESLERFITALADEPIPRGCRPPIATGPTREVVSRRNAETLLCNLYCLMTTNKNTLSLSLSPNSYAGKEKINAGFLNLIKLAEVRRLIVLQRGFYDRANPNKSRHARMKPTPELLAIIGSGIGSDSIFAEPHHLINLHSESGEDIPQERWKLTKKETRRLARMERELKAINEVISAFKITCIRLSKSKKHRRHKSARRTPPKPFWKASARSGPTILYPVLYAVFTGDFQHGGRLYTGRGGHINLSKEERATIRIDGEPTIELDYGGLHIRMLYHLKGDSYPLEGDPYNDVLREMGLKPELIFFRFPTIRGDLKELLLGLINGQGSEERAISNANFRLFRSWFKIHNQEQRKEEESRCLQRAERWRKAGLCDVKGEPTVAPVIEAFKKAHRAIADYFSTGCGLRLQAIDSNIARSVLHRMMLANPQLTIPTLPIHDSFIVQATFHDELHEAMLACYQSEMERVTGTRREFSVPVKGGKNERLNPLSHHYAPPVPDLK